MKNMCVSAGISVFLNQVRYEYPYQKMTGSIKNLSFFGFYIRNRIYKQINFYRNAPRSYVSTELNN